MDPSELEGLEFELDTDTPSHGMQEGDLKKILRSSYRLPIEESDSISVQLNNTPLKIANVSMGGIGLLLDVPEQSQPDNPIKILTLQIDEEVFTVHGRLAHISPHESGKFICGIEFKEMSAEMKRVLGDFIEENRCKRFGVR